MTNRRNFKVAIILVIIASSFLVLSGIFGLALFNESAFTEFFNELLQSDYNGSTLQQFLIDNGAGELIPQVAQITYYMMIVLSLIAILLNILPALFAILSFNDASLDIVKFQEKKRRHNCIAIFIAIAFFLGRTVFGLNFASEGMINLVSTLTFTASLFYIYCFFTIRRVVKINEMLYYRVNTKEYQEYKPYQENENKEDEFSINQDNYKVDSEPIAEVNLDKPDINKTMQDNANMDELYELIAKLEKSYHNNEISEQDYKRMRQTIIDNHFKK